MLSDIIAPRRLRAGDPQALAALVAVAGWPVLAYCERAGAGADTARAVVLAFVTFRRRVVEAHDDRSPDLERILLESVRDAVDEVRGAAPQGDTESAAADALARASPRPLSPRLATQLLHALVEAAPVAGARAHVRDAAERSYAEAYAAAEPAPAAAGEEDLAAASPLLLRAAQAHRDEPAPRAPADQEPQREAKAEPEPDREAPPSATAPVAPPTPIARFRALPPLTRAGAFAAALVLLWIVVGALSGDDDGATPSTVTVARTVTVAAPAPRAADTATTPAPAARAQVVRGTPRRPLTAGGARFEVVPTADASWARQIRAEEPRRGTRWVTLAVRTRNVRRRDLVLRTLGYRLRTATGMVIGPRILDVGEGPPSSREGRLPRGARASVHLGFEVAFEVRGLSFAFEPGGLDEPTVLVALGDIQPR